MALKNVFLFIFTHVQFVIIKIIQLSLYFPRVVFYVIWLRQNWLGFGQEAGYEVVTVPDSPGVSFYVGGISPTSSKTSPDGRCRLGSAWRPREHRHIAIFLIPS